MTAGGKPLRWAGAITIAAIAIARCVITFAPQVVFDVDPAIDPTPLPGLGPAGSLVLDALLLGACACALLGEALSGRGIDWRLLALALIPAPWVIWHGTADALDLWRGMTWLAAAVACVAVAHLGRDREIRVVLVALLVSVLVPLLVRGALQSSISGLGVSLDGAEHADTIAEFEANRDIFFADRGWEADSPAARIYERRLRQPDPRGWFPTTNIWASMMAFGLVFSGGLAAGAVRRRLGMAWLIVSCVAVAIFAGALLMARSKGAVLASAVGIALLLAPLLSTRLRVLMARRGGAVAVALVAATVLAVVVRGALLPEGWLGEKSLLFRWHYVSGAARVLGDHALLGVGPDGFQPAYTMARSPRSPEEVTSAHNVFADWLATLGVGGLAWAGLLLVLLGRAAGKVPQDDGADPAPAPRAALPAAAAVAILALLPALVVEAAEMDHLSNQIARGLGVLGFVALAAGLSVVVSRIGSAVAGWALAAAAVTLAVHAQLEMTFFDPGSVTWMMVILGLAGGAAARPQGAGPGASLSAALLVLAIWVGFFGAGRVLGAQSAVNRAASLLYPPPDTRDERLRGRERAADLLVTAHDAAPSWSMPLEEAVRQTLVAASLAEGARRLELTERAIELAERGVSEHGRPTAVAIAAEAHWFRAAQTNLEVSWQAAIDHARALTQVDPHGIGSWRLLGDVLWEAGRREEAASAYEEALGNDAGFELDPLKQLSERDRESLRERISGAGDPSPGP